MKVQVQPDVLLKILIANLFDVPGRITKSQIEVTVMPHPARIVPSEVTTAEVLGIIEAGKTSLMSMTNKSVPRG